MIKEMKQKIQGETENKNICATIQPTNQKEFLIFFISRCLKSNFNVYIEKMQRIV